MYINPPAAEKCNCLRLKYVPTWTVCCKRMGDINNGFCEGNARRDSIYVIPPGNNVSSKEQTEA